MRVAIAGGDCQCVVPIKLEEDDGLRYIRMATLACINVVSSRFLPSFRGFLPVRRIVFTLLGWAAMSASWF